MAGLQYYFFPTDFFYPRPSCTNGDNTSNRVLHVQTQKQADAENIEKCRIVVHNDVQGTSNKLCYQAPQASTSCTALIPYPCIIKKELRRKRSIVANRCNNCGLVLSGGLLGFVFSRNLATLSTGVIFGGALLARSTFSLKIWRQGKSSLPFILGQAALSAVLLWKNFQSYSLTKKVFPTGFYAAISADALLLLVLISGGNPPPKKLKSSPSFAS